MIRGACVAGAAALLLGCAHGISDIDDGLNARQRAARLGAISDWDMRGQLRVDDGERRERMRATWEQRGDRISLIGRGAVGPVGWFQIAGNADQLTIETSRSEPRTLENPEFDLSTELGWWLPVTSLEYWLLGVADPDYPADADRGPAGTLTALTQRDWRVGYEEYQLAAGLLVPRLIRFRHAELELELTVASWSPAQP